MKELLPGDQIDNFRIEEQLHTSAVAHLYRAIDLLYQDQVVLKIPLDDIKNNPVILYHHQNEERISTFLNHPSCVRYLAREKSYQYLILEYIEGNDLRELLKKEERFALDEAIHLCCQIAAGISHLHANRILHLDLKPENIIVTPAKQVKIVDFGISNHLDHDDTLGRDFPGPKGTPYYIAPEQLCGARNYKQSDIYSLGMILFEMLTGQMPFEKSKKISKVRERLKKNPIPPRYFDKTIPPAIQEIILKCLNREPLQRYDDAGHFIDDLQNYRYLPTGTQGHIVTKPLSLLSYFNFSGCSTILHNSPPLQSHGSTEKQLLGCIADHENSDLVVEHIRREALLNGGQITLLHIIDEEDLSGYEKYAMELEGASLSSRLDEYLSTLKKYGLSPDLRIKKGDTTEGILDTAMQIIPDCVVMGPPRPRTFFSKILHGSVLEKVIGSGISHVTIAQPSKLITTPNITQFHNLSAEELNNLKLFFCDSWVQHLNWLTHLSHTLLQSESTPPVIKEKCCPLWVWLQSVKDVPEFQHRWTILDNCHSEFHSALQIMAMHCRQGNPDTMRNLYKYRAVPLAVEMKELLKETINMM